MSELIDKNEVVNKLIRLENAYQFYKEKWDADVLYRRICELEIGIGKTPGKEICYCKDCANTCDGNSGLICLVWGAGTSPNGWCYKGERKENE
jgi:hypothetical protein